MSPFDLPHHPEIMDYDVWGGWSPSVGPNSPLSDSCAPAGDQDGSAVSAVSAWSGAGFPVSQMLLGVPAYGHSYRVSQSDALDASGNIQLYAKFDKSDQPQGDKWDTTAGSVDVCGNPTAIGGIFQFWGLVEFGFLKDDGTAADGIKYYFDDCSKTVRAPEALSLIDSLMALSGQPYVYNTTSEVMVSFDDATSFSTPLLVLFCCEGNR